jgi:hypothetical protein
VRSRFGVHDPAADLPVTAALVDAGVLEADLELADDADAALDEEASELVDDREALEAATVERIAGATDVSVNRRLGGGERWFVADDDGMTVRQWGARQVAALDVAGAALLERRLPEWAERDPTERETALALVRYGASTCPDCGSPFEVPDGPRVVCCGGRSLVGERRCGTCEYVVVDRNDLPEEARAEGERSDGPRGGPLAGERA